MPNASFELNQTRSSTNQLEDSFLYDSNVLGIATVKVHQLAKSEYFSDWLKLMNLQGKLIGKILVKT